MLLVEFRFCQLALDFGGLISIIRFFYRFHDIAVLVKTVIHLIKLSELPQQFLFLPGVANKPNLFYVT